MSPEFKLVLRTLSSYVMLITGAFLIGWFLFIIITSLFGLNFYNDDMLEGLIFLFIMALVIIGVAGIINVSLSIDLIADTKMKAFDLTDKQAPFRKKLIRFGLLSFCSLLLIAFIGDYVKQKSEEKDFTQITIDVAKAKSAELFRAVAYLQDTTEQEEIASLLSQVENSSAKLSKLDLFFFRQVDGKEQLIKLNKHLNLTLMQEQGERNLVTILSGAEKTLVLAMLEDSQQEAKILKTEEGQIQCYFPLSQGTEKLVLRTQTNTGFTARRSRSLF